MDATALAREAQLERLNRLAPPPVVGGEPEPEPEQMDVDDNVTPPPVRSMIASIIESVIDDSSRGSELEPAQQLALPSIGASDETAADAAARLVVDLVEEAAARAGRTRREGGDWHPQIDAFWVAGGAPTAAAAAGAIAGGTDGPIGPIREEDFSGRVPLAAGGGSRAWRAGERELELELELELERARARERDDSRR